MSNINEAFESHQIDDDESAFNYSLNIELELERMMSDRDDIHGITDLYAETETSLEDEEFVKKNIFDSHLYVSECKKYKSSLQTLSLNIESCIQEKQDLMTRLETINRSLKNLKDCSDDEFSKHLKGFDTLIDSLCEQISMKTEDIKKMKRHIKCLFKDTHHYTSADPKRICGICLLNEVDQCVVPCGHTMCGICASKIINSDKCFACRSHVDKVIGLFYI